MMGAVTIAAKAGLVWLKRRGFLFYVSMINGSTLPKLMWNSVSDHRNGAGYFSDPVGGKPSLLAYWRQLAEFQLTSTFVISKRPTEEGYAAVKNSLTPIWGEDGVTVKDTGAFLEFTPSKGAAGINDGLGSTSVGVIILPGMLVSPLAYAPLARSLAQKGYTSYIVRFAIDLAWYDWETAVDIMSRPQLQLQGNDEKCPSSPTRWVLAGHSMGTLAIEKIYAEKPGSVEGAVFIAGGKRVREALKGESLSMLTLWGSRDNLCPPEEAGKEESGESAHKPPGAEETVVVEGGNHRGFASYTWQPLDWEATIPQQEQRRITVEAIADFIGRRVEK